MNVGKHKHAAFDPTVVEMRKELARRIVSHVPEDGVKATEISGMSLYRHSAPSACNSSTYEPRLVVFVQGEKRFNVGNATYLCDGSNFLLTSVDLPVVSQVITATEKQPILGLLLKLDMPLVREILSQQEFHLRESRDSFTRPYWAKNAHTTAGRATPSAG